MPDLDELGPHLRRVVDTCNVYLLDDGTTTIAIDFGSGAVLDAIGPRAGIDAVLVTHHHRDQVQGLPAAVAAGIPIWVPPVERELIDRIDEHWQARQLENNYDVREDRFSLLTSVPVTGTVTEYRTMGFGGMELRPLPTPGHTVGSVSYLAEVDGRRIAFTGDLLYGRGKVWSLAATMWAYGEIPGVASTLLSLLTLRRERLDVLYPSHGEPIEDVNDTIDRTIDALRRMLAFRGSHVDLDDWIQRPYVPLTPHLLHNRTSHSFGYVLVSASGKALVFDYGYDAITGLPASADRGARRPWLYSLDDLKRDHGVSKIDVVVPTHYHDDHVAGFNLLHDVEGTEVWVPDSFADILETPERYDLPCLWYDPIPVTRRIPVGGTVRWEEYEISIHDLPGHTKYAAAYSFEVDGTRVVVSGDQQDMGWGRHPFPERLNYIYANRVSIGDFAKSAALYARLEPELMVGGHWPPRFVQPDYLEMLSTRGELMDELHRELLPLEEVDLGLEGFAARLEPYRSTVEPNATVEIEAWVRNPFPRTDTVKVTLVVPDGWVVEPPTRSVTLPEGEATTVDFRVRVGSVPVRRARIAADVTVGGRRLGQHAEALVTVR